MCNGGDIRDFASKNMLKWAKKSKIGVKHAKYTPS